MALLAVPGPSAMELLPMLEIESIDLNRFRLSANDEEKTALAARLFAVWQPLFAHLKEKSPEFHRSLHIDDPSARWKRLWFYRQNGKDLGAIIGRVHEHTVEGVQIIRITMNAGLDPSIVGANVGGSALAKTLLWALWIARSRPVFLIDSVSSAPALAAMVKAFPEVRPSPAGLMPEPLWKYAEAAAPALGCVPVAGKPLGVVRSHAVISQRALQSEKPRSLRAQAIEQWFQRTVGPGECLLIVCPISRSYAGRRFGHWIADKLKRIAGVK